MLKLYCRSLGCPKNRVDAERALGRLRLPFTTAERPDEADLIFINTCAFITPAVEESVRAVLEAAAHGAKPPLLAVAGCLVGRYGEAALAPDLPEVDLWLDNRELESWPARLEQLARKVMAPSQPAKKTDRNCGNRELRYARLLSTPPSYAWLKIADGCDHACAFCTIPSIRGPFRSESAEDIAAEAELLLESGVRELILVAQDSSAWGRDLSPRRDPRHLLERLLLLPGLARLRLMYLYPAGLSRELLGFLASAGPPFVPYFDVPLQHAALKTLSRMGRPFAAKPRAAVERIRDFFPEAALRTSLITGFPGESEDDFKELLAFVEEARFMHLGVFAYEAEEGTAAAGLPDQIPVALREERRGLVMEAQRRISRELLEAFRGLTLELLVDAPQPEWPGLYRARAWFQAPEVDGFTYLSGPDIAPGDLVQAEIVDLASDYDLSALA